VFFFGFFFGFFAEKSLLSGVKIFFVIWGQHIFFQIHLKKTNATPWPSFFDILASFVVKNVCALFREIE